MPMTYDQSQSRELGPQSLPSAFMAGNPVTWAITAAASEFYISRNRELEPALDPITAMWHMEVLTNILYIFEKQRNTFLFKFKKKMFIRSFVWKAESGREKSFICWLTPQISARRGPGQSQDPGTRSKFPLGDNDATTLSHSCCLAGCEPHREAGMESRAVAPSRGTLVVSLTFAPRQLLSPVPQGLLNHITEV